VVHASDATARTAGVHSIRRAVARPVPGVTAAATATTASHTPNAWSGSTASVRTTVNGTNPGQRRRRAEAHADDRQDQPFGPHHTKYLPGVPPASRRCSELPPGFTAPEAATASLSTACLVSVAGATAVTGDLSALAKVPVSRGVLGDTPRLGTTPAVRIVSRRRPAAV
jgi:hypothetical protein